MFHSHEVVGAIGFELEPLSRREAERSEAGSLLAKSGAQRRTSAAFHSHEVVGAIGFEPMTSTV